MLVIINIKNEIEISNFNTTNLDFRAYYTDGNYFTSSVNEISIF